VTLFQIAYCLYTQEALYENLYLYAKIHVYLQPQTSPETAIPAAKSEDKNVNVII
jgi:hypothetical protein